MARPGQIFQMRNDFLAQSARAFQTNTINACLVYHVQAMYFSIVIFPEIVK